MEETVDLEESEDVQEEDAGSGAPESDEDVQEDVVDTDSEVEDGEQGAPAEAEEPVSGTADLDEPAADDWSGDEPVELVSETVQTVDQTDAAPYLADISMLLVLLIFFLGVGSGLISSGIMWGRFRK